MALIGLAHFARRTEKSLGLFSINFLRFGGSATVEAEALGSGSPIRREGTPAINFLWFGGSATLQAEALGSGSPIRRECTPAIFAIPETHQKPFGTHLFKNYRRRLENGGRDTCSVQ